MVRKVLLDTDILIGELRQPAIKTVWKELKEEKLKLHICGISLTELWAGESMAKVAEKRRVRRLLKSVEVLSLTDKILERAGEELRKDRDLYLADALVAATALVHKLPLASLNRRHFQGVGGLQLYLPE